MRRPPLILLALAVVFSASTWLYVSRVLVPQQIAYSEIHGNPRGNLSDLYPRWLGSRELLLRGRDPYSPEITREIQIGYYGRPLDPARPYDPGDQEAFAYPVYVALLLAPTVKLPFPEVQVIMHWVLGGLTLLSVVLWLRVVRWKPDVITTLALLTLTLGTFWVVQGIKLQQLSLLVAPMIAACVYLLIRNRPVASGILLALATVKPQIAVPLAGWLMLWACSRIRLRWKLVASFVVTLVALAAAGEVLLPGWIHEFRAALAAYRSYTRHLSPLDEVATPVVGIPLAIAVIAVVTVMGRRARRVPAGSELFSWTTAVVLAANLLVIPTVAPYNQLLLLPGIFLLLRNWNRLRVNRAIRVLGWASAACLAWGWVMTTGLTLFSFVTPAVQRLWTVPLWTSIVTPIPIAVCLAMCLRQMLSRSREAALTTSH